MSLSASVGEGVGEEIPHLLKAKCHRGDPVIEERARINLDQYFTTLSSPLSFSFFTKTFDFENLLSHNIHIYYDNM